MKFEEIIGRLEEITNELDDEGIPLERAMELYEEGVKLSKMADEIITRAEVRVRELSENE